MTHSPTSFSSSHPLQPCPSSPNCVCSVDLDESHKIEPLVYKDIDGEEVWRVVKEVLDRFPRSKRVKEEGDYSHYEIKTRLLRFTDDVEVWHDVSTKTVHFRSASRIGYSDLGANRRRVERLKQLIAEKLKA